MKKYKVFAYKKNKKIKNLEDYVFEMEVKSKSAAKLIMELLKENYFIMDGEITKLDNVRIEK